MATMTKKDFELIARTILDMPLNTQGEITPYLRGHVAICFADMLRVTNPSFDRNRFMKACGVCT